MNPTISQSPQVLQRKVVPVTGDDTHTLGQENPEEREKEIETLKKQLEIAKTKNDFNSVYEIMNRIKNLKQVKESILPSVASGIARRGSGPSTISDPSGHVYGQPQSYAVQKLNDPEENRKEKEHELDKLERELEFAKDDNDYDKIYILMNRIEGIRELLKR